MQIPYSKKEKKLADQEFNKFVKELDLKISYVKLNKDFTKNKYNIEFSRNPRKFINIFRQ